jgi:hypothetical protein
MEKNFDDVTTELEKTIREGQRLQSPKNWAWGVGLFSLLTLLVGGIIMGMCVAKNEDGEDIGGGLAFLNVAFWLGLGFSLFFMIRYGFFSTHFRAVRGVIGEFNRPGNETTGSGLKRAFHNHLVHHYNYAHHTEFASPIWFVIGCVSVAVTTVLNMTLTVRTLQKQYSNQEYVYGFGIIPAWIFTVGCFWAFFIRKSNGRVFKIHNAALQPLIRKNNEFMASMRSGF